jgi:hypothetical protein
MKRYIIIFLAFISTSQTSAFAQDNASTLKEFVKGIPSLETEKFSSIEGLNDAAKKKASKTFTLTKDNIAEALKASQGKTCIVTVENHTIVKFSDTKNCTSSGSWGAGMPFGEGFIQNGSLAPTKDYINNIIGRPDTQLRTLFIF